VRAANDGRPIDVVVSSVGRDLFPRMVDLLGPGGASCSTAHERLHGHVPRQARRPSPSPRCTRAPGSARSTACSWYHGLTPTGPSDAPDDPTAEAAIETALSMGARVARGDAHGRAGRAPQACRRPRGTVSLETLGRARGFVWPDVIPDYDTDPDGYRRYQDATLKPFARPSAVCSRAPTTRAALPM